MKSDMDVMPVGNNIGNGTSYCRATSNTKMSGAQTYEMGAN
jgi:hypothetical protein